MFQSFDDHCQRIIVFIF